LNTTRHTLASSVRSESLFRDVSDGSTAAYWISAGAVTKPDAEAEPVAEYDGSWRTPSVRFVSGNDVLRRRCSLKTNLHGGVMRAAGRRQQHNAVLIGERAFTTAGQHLGAVVGIASNITSRPTSRCSRGEGIMSDQAHNQPRGSCRVLKFNILRSMDALLFW
jgi:hypothetical protein